MSRLIFAAAVLFAACAAPLPCTQALCPSRRDGSYRVSGWDKTLVVAPGQPPLPIVSDSSVEVQDGTVEFVNRRAVVRADAGASFRFSVSSDSAHVPSILVSSGGVSVALSSTSAASPVPLSAPYRLGSER